MPTKVKTPVFFVATRSKKEPLVVNFYTKKGKQVAFSEVKKEKTKEGVRFYANV